MSADSGAGANGGEREELLALLKEAVSTWDADLARDAAARAMALGMEPSAAIADGLSEGMSLVSSRFRDGELFLPQVLAASRAMEAALEVIGPHIDSTAPVSQGVIVIGTVQGDIHEIGKNIVIAFLRGAGYTVHDLGKDVSPERFLDSVKDLGADVLGASALMTTTLVHQRRIVQMLREERLDVPTLFGGACCTRKWVDDIGGGAYCECGAEVVDRVRAMRREG